MNENDHHHDHHAMMVEDFKQRFWVSLIITLPVLLLSPLIQRFIGLDGVINIPGSAYISLVLASVIFFYGGKPFLQGLKAEIKARNPGMMTLIGVAISVAYFYSVAVVFGLEGEVFFWELATLVDVMLLGHWIEMRSVMGASKALEELAKLMPATAHRLSVDGSSEEVSISELKVNDKVLVKPGEKIPVDAVVIDGESSVNEAMLTGESRPVNKQINHQVVGGSINQDGSLTLKVEKIGNDTYLAQVVELVKNAQASKSQTQDLANKAAFWLTIVAITAGFITFGVWIVAGQTVTFALARMVTVMVITCPHALGLAIPLVVANSTAKTAQQGLLIRNRNGFETARNVTAVVFDKTGTLTNGDFRVAKTVILDDNFDKQVIADLAASLESHSEHLLAGPIVSVGNSKLKVSKFKTLPGKGVAGIVGGKNVAVVGPNYLSAARIELNQQLVNQIPDGGTVVYVLVDDSPAMAIVLADTIRDESKQAIKQLQLKNIKVMMLTGDSEIVAKSVAGELGIDDYFAGVLPENKQIKIHEIQKTGEIVAMVGDGVNDAPALAAADVGIAIGAGTDVAAETADVVLVSNDPRDVDKIVRYAGTTYDKMKQNLWYATGYNIFAIPLAAGLLYPIGIVLSPAVGAALMSLSTVVVAINARGLRLE